MNGSNHSLGNASLLRSLVLHPGHPAQPVRRPGCRLDLSLNDCGCWFSSLSLRLGLRSAGPERIKETLVHILVICAAEMLKFSDIVFFYVRTCRVRAWCSSDQP